MARVMAVLLAVMLMCVVAVSAARTGPGRVLAQVPSSSIAPTPSFFGAPDSSPPEGAPIESPMESPVESPVEAPPAWAPVWEPVSAPVSAGATTPASAPAPIRGY